MGTTSLAVNLGCILAKDEHNSVALVDLDLCLGDADVFLDTIPDTPWSTWPRTLRGWTSRC